MQIYPSTEHFNCIKKYNLKKNALANGVYTIYNTRFGLKKKDIDYRIVFSST